MISVLYEKIVTLRGMQGNEDGRVWRRIHMDDTDIDRKIID